jgi:DNA-binding NtrC family response regulator
MSAPKLCLIEDDPIMGESLCDRFALEGFAFDWHQDGESALRHIGRESYAAIISDVRLPDLGGDDLFRRLLARGTRLPPLMFITGYGSIDRAVEALKLGAADYITKPFDIEHLIARTRALIGPAAAASRPTREDSLGVSPAMRRVEEMLPRIGTQAETVLLTGESGVGKEMVARLLHVHASVRHGAGPFIAVNCGALPETLLESELFGYERGAFTGATRTRKGLFEQAEGGTLFLDEIGDMPGVMQVKLLRAIQERQIMRVGAERALSLSIRLVCATNKDLKKLVDEGRFREDLFYRVNVIHLRIPPLRERSDDILWLARTFLRDRQRVGIARRLSLTAESALLRHDWPGNVRELKHCIERACIMAHGPAIEPWDLFETDFAADESTSVAASNLNAYLRSCEREFIVRALEQHHWHVTETAQGLGISRKNLWEKMRKLGIGEKQSSPTVSGSPPGNPRA